MRHDRRVFRVVGVTVATTLDFRPDLVRRKFSVIDEFENVVFKRLDNENGARYK